MHASESLTHTFTLVLTGSDPLVPENLDRLFEAGCDDAIFGLRDGVYTAEFAREAASFSEALTTAIRAVEGAVPGLIVSRVEPEELVTAAEIAKRLKRSRESVRQQVTGGRGAGLFPRPAAWLSNGTRLFNWSEVAACYAHDPSAVEASELRTVANSFLAIRHFLARHASDESPDVSRASIEDLVSSLFGTDAIVFDAIRGKLGKNEL